MTTVIPIHPVSRAELLQELRAKENSLLDDEQDFLHIAEAVWPETARTRRRLTSVSFASSSTARSSPGFRASTI